MGQHQRFARHDVCPNLPRCSDSRCSKSNMPSFELSFTTTQPLRLQNQPGKRWCSAAGSFWDDLQSMPLRATVPTSWMRGLDFFFGAEDWSALWAMVRAECVVAPVQNTTRRTDKQQMQSRVRKLLHWHVLVKKEEPWQAARTRHQFQSPNKLFKRSRASILLTQNPPAPASGSNFSSVLVRSSRACPHYTPKDASTQ